MEFVQGIEDFINTIIYLGLMIFCLVQVRKKGMVFLAIGVGLLFLDSLGWLVFSIFINRIPYQLYDIFYMIVGQTNFVANLGFALFFVLGICRITSSLVKKDDETTQTHRIKDLTPPQKFGSLGLYVSTLAAGFLLMVLGIIFFAVINANHGPDGALVTMALIILIGCILMIISWVYFLMLLYRVWKFAIIESRRHGLTPSIDTPGKAVGFLFIPFFNFYWIFQAYGSLPKDLNAIAGAKNISVNVSEGLGLTLAILCLVGVIPFIGYILWLAALIIMPIFMSSLINMCKRLSEVSSTRV